MRTRARRGLDWQSEPGLASEFDREVSAGSEGQLWRNHRPVRSVSMGRSESLNISLHLSPRSFADVLPLPLLADLLGDEVVNQGFGQSSRAGGGAALGGDAVGVTQLGHEVKDRHSFVLGKVRGAKKNWEASAVLSLPAIQSCVPLPGDPDTPRPLPRSVRERAQIGPLTLLNDRPIAPLAHRTPHTSRRNPDGLK